MAWSGYWKEIPFPAHSHRRPIAIADTRSFRDSFKAGGRTPRTVNIAVKVVRSCLAVAQRQGYISDNRAEAVEAIVGTPGGREACTPGQVASLVGAADAD